jgi:hypothetical protein
MKTFDEFLNETTHKQDPTGYRPAPWQDRSVKRNSDEDGPILCITLKE